MKKFTMLSSVLASALMMTVVSCSSSDDITGGNGSGNAEGTTSYIAITLLVVLIARERVSTMMGRIRRIILPRYVSTSIMPMVLLIRYKLLVKKVLKTILTIM